jgi:hypothetical protein
MLSLRRSFIPGIRVMGGWWFNAAVQSYVALQLPHSGKGPAQQACADDARFTYTLDASRQDEAAGRDHARCRSRRGSWRAPP